METNTTMVLGASEKEERYSNKAVKALLRHGHPVIAVGNRKGEIGRVPIQTNWPEAESVDTLTIYINAKLQEEVKEKIWKLKPRRLIFNPGTENTELASEARKAGMEVVEACTLVLLATEQF